MLTKKWSRKVKTSYNIAFELSSNRKRGGNAYVFVCVGVCVDVEKKYSETLCLFLTSMEKARMRKLSRIN